MTAQTRLKRWLVNPATALVPVAPIPFAVVWQQLGDIPDLLWPCVAQVIGCYLLFRHAEWMEGQKNQEAERVRAHGAAEAEKERAFEQKMVETKWAIESERIGRLLAHARKQPITVHPTEDTVGFQMGCLPADQGTKPARRKPAT